MKDEGDTNNLIQIIDLENGNHHLSKPISRIRGTNKKDAISVENYTENKDLQRAIVASLIQTNSIINLSDEENDLEVHFVNPTSSFRRKPFKFPSLTEPGESSNSKKSEFVCEICVETKAQSGSFTIKGCTHCYCKECMARYVAAKLQENVTSIRCPESNCVGVLEPEFCRDILPKEVFDRWGNALCESLILGIQKFYCPFKDCSAPLLIDEGGALVKESECPHCHRMFCAQCKVVWHVGIECEEFMKLGKGEREREDIMLMKLAKNKKWQRCPKCMYFVERSSGCVYMKCRCGFAFCYSCGAEMKLHTSLCSKCKGADFA